MLHYRIFRSAPLIAAVAFISLYLLGGCSAKEASSEPQVSMDEQQKGKLSEMNHTAETLYKKAMEGAIEEARAELIVIGNQITQIRFEGITTVEGVNALSNTIVKAKRVFNAVKFSQHEGIIAAARVRLAIDALTHPNQPMWLQYYKVLVEDLSSIRKAAEDKQVAETRKALDVMYQHYSIIRPAILINRDAAEVEKADSLFAFLGSQMAAKQVQYEQVRAGIEQLQQELDEMFMKKHAQAYAPLTDSGKPIVWATGIGSAIVIVLSYVAWRKFKNEKGYVAVRKEDRY